MILSVSNNVDQKNYPELRADAQRVATLIMENLPAAVFPNKSHVGAWLHRLLDNPRMGIATEASGNRIVVLYNDPAIKDPIPFLTVNIR